ncbi:MAG: hypothetical protein IT372_22855, partial [Polyangiaceae bacterium]|nr:hypothetical protein [Polyangiaceae bacterium]
MSAIPLSAMDLISGEAIDARGSGSRPHVEPPYAPNPAEARDVADDGVPWVGGRGRAAERERLRALVDAHFDAVWCALRRLGVLETELDDAAQQVFLVASRRLEDIEQGRERAFLLGAAAHVASHARRAHRRRREVPEPLDEALDRTDPGPLPDEALDR